MPFPRFPECNCGWHADEFADANLPPEALSDPLVCLPPPVELTPEMAALADRYLENDIDWHHYPAFQAAAFLKPWTKERHTQRRHRYEVVKQSAESQGFVIPAALSELLMTDAYVDRLHHNCVWLNLPDQLARLPADPQFAVFEFLIEGQGLWLWNLLLSPDGTHTIITSQHSFGRSRGDSSGHATDPSTFKVWQCAESLNLLLLHFFLDAAKHDGNYIAHLANYFADVAG